MIAKYKENAAIRVDDISFICKRVDKEEGWMIVVDGVLIGVGKEVGEKIFEAFSSINKSHTYEYTDRDSIYYSKCMYGRG